MEHNQIRLIKPSAIDTIEPKCFFTLCRRIFRVHRESISKSPLGHATNQNFEEKKKYYP